MYAPSTARKMRWTAEEYLSMEAQSSIKHEYFDGEVFAMAGARAEHNRLAGALLVAIGRRIEGGRCRVLTSDQRIHVPGTGLYTYPDGGVGCGKWEIHTDGMSLLNPALLFEVLSDSTREYDRGAKLEHYRTIASLRHILLVETAERCVEHHHRLSDGTWATTVVREGSIALADLGGAVALDDVYLPEVE